MNKLNANVLKKIIVLTITAVAAFSIMGCTVKKTVTTTETQSDTDVDGNTTSSTTTNMDGDVTGEITETNEEIAGETSFGLKDYEGFYCYTGTEEMEDYEVTYTYGYQFNGDGTGVSYVQDVVDFTWNETEIHFGEFTEPFTMEPGKLTVNGIVYNKIDGNFITPNPYFVDVDNIENGIYYVDIYEGGIHDTDGNVTIDTEIYTEESYDIVDIGCMSEGDVIYINGQLIPVTSIQETDFGIININGGIENMGSALRAIDESNCYVYVGMDMECSYTRQGLASFAVSDNVKLIDNRDPAEEKVYTGTDAVSALKEIVKEYPLTCYDCKIMVEEGKIIEIHRMYRP